MPLTSADSPAASSAAVAGTCPDRLTRSVRAQVRLGLGWPKTAERVVGALRSNLPGPADLLPAHLLQGDPACYQSHLLHAEPDGSFSIAVMVWRPGQETVIHDHVAWCVTAVLQGREYEEIFALAQGGRALVFAARNANPAGSVSGFAPPRRHPPRPQYRRWRRHLDARVRRRHLLPGHQHPPRVQPPRAPVNPWPGPWPVSGAR